MTVRELIEVLEQFDEDMEVKIGMAQSCGSNFAMNICNEPEELTINDWNNRKYKAVVLTEGRQIGTVDYNEENNEEY